jgi:hypothetical protein
MASGNTWEILHLKQAVSELEQNPGCRASAPGFLLPGAWELAVKK